MRADPALNRPSLPDSAPLTVLAVFNVSAPVWADDLPLVDHGPVSPAADGGRRAFCPVLRTMLHAAVALPAANRGPALHAPLSAG